jgi:hypothetical protein
MKRMKLVLALAAVMAMLVASAVPAMAKGNGGGHGSGGHMATAQNAGGHNTSGHAGNAHRGEAHEGVFDADFGVVNGDDFALPALGFSDPLVIDHDDILPVDSI